MGANSHTRIVYGGEFDLSAEVFSIAAPLAGRVAAAPRPDAYLAEVEDVADAVHALAHVAVGLLAERTARGKVANLRFEDRGRAVRALVDLTPRPRQPQVDGLLEAGTWAAALTEHVRPYAAGLADYLAATKPPGTTRGALSVSERIEASLREVDRAAITLERKLDRAERDRAARRGASHPSKAEQAWLRTRQLYRLAARAACGGLKRQRRQHKRFLARHRRSCTTPLSLRH